MLLLRQSLRAIIFSMGFFIFLAASSNLFVFKEKAAPLGNT
jgi:hypothetical protein